MFFFTILLLTNSNSIPQGFLACLFKYLKLCTSTDIESIILFGNTLHLIWTHVHSETGIIVKIVMKLFPVMNCKFECIYITSAKLKYFVIF